MRPVSTPPRPRGRPPLSVDRIIAEATTILDDEGAQALSMRTLAQRLNTGTTTIYRHFESRDDLNARAINAVMAEVEVDTEALRHQPWQQACETVVHAMFDVLHRHPNVAPLMLERVPVGPRMLAVRERTLGILLEAGFAPRLALQAWATLARFVLGFGAQLNAAEPEPPATWAETVDWTQIPATLAVAKHFPIPLENEFAFGVKLLIRGLEGELSDSPS